MQRKLKKRIDEVRMREEERRIKEEIEKEEERKKEQIKKCRLLAVAAANHVAEQIKIREAKFISYCRRMEEIKKEEEERIKNVEKLRVQNEEVQRTKERSREIVEIRCMEKEDKLSRVNKTNITTNINANIDNTNSKTENDIHSNMNKNSYKINSNVRKDDTSTESPTIISLKSYLLKYTAGDTSKSLNITNSKSDTTNDDSNTNNSDSKTKAIISHKNSELNSAILLSKTNVTSVEESMPNYMHHTQLEKNTTVSPIKNGKDVFGKITPARMTANSATRKKEKEKSSKIQDNLNTQCRKIIHGNKAIKSAKVFGARVNDKKNNPKKEGSKSSYNYSDLSEISETFLNGSLEFCWTQNTSDDIIISNSQKQKNESVNQREHKQNMSGNKSGGKDSGTSVHQVLHSDKEKIEKKNRIQEFTSKHNENENIIGNEYYDYLVANSRNLFKYVTGNRIVSTGVMGERTNSEISSSAISNKCESNTTRNEYGNKIDHFNSPIDISEVKNESNQKRTSQCRNLTDPRSPKNKKNNNFEVEEEYLRDGDKIDRTNTHHHSAQRLTKHLSPSNRINSERPSLESFGPERFLPPHTGCTRTYVSNSLYNSHKDFFEPTQTPDKNAPIRRNSVPVSVSVRAEHPRACVHDRMLSSAGARTERGYTFDRKEESGIWYEGSEYLESERGIGPGSGTWDEFRGHGERGYGTRKDGVVSETRGEGIRESIGEGTRESIGEGTREGMGMGMGFEVPVKELKISDKNNVPCNGIESCLGTEPKEAVVFRYGVRSVRAVVSAYRATSNAVDDLSTTGRTEEKSDGKDIRGGSRESRNRPVKSDRKKSKNESVKTENRTQRDSCTGHWDGMANFWISKF